jgi:hypothetical protein
MYNLGGYGYTAREADGQIATILAYSLAGVGLGIMRHDFHYVQITRLLNGLDWFCEYVGVWHFCWLKPGRNARIRVESIDGAVVYETKVSTRRVLRPCTANMLRTITSIASRRLILAMIRR